MSPSPSAAVCPPLLLGRQSPPLPHCNADKATTETGRRRPQMAAPPVSNSDCGGGSNRNKTAGSPLVSGEHERLQSPAAAPQEPVGKRAKQSLIETSSSSSSKRKDACNSSSSNNSSRQLLLLTVNPNYRSLSPSPPPPPRLPPPSPPAAVPGGADQEEDAAFPPPPSYGTLKRMTSYRR